MKRALSALVTITPLLLPLVLLSAAPAVVYGDCPPGAFGTVLAWVSRTREAEALSPLVDDPVLQRAAARYARELAGRGVLSHRDLEGGNVLDRLQAEGGTTTLAGEILGSGPGPAEVCAAWGASGSHRSVALGTHWTHVGAGCAARGTRQVWVVIFAARRIADLRVEAVGGCAGSRPGQRREGADAPAGYRVSGILPPAEGRRPFLLSGLAPVQAVSWNADTGEFLFLLGPESGERYQRLGFVDAAGTVTVTDAFYPARVATSSPGTAPR
jgi:hypothetical protein